MKQLVHLMMCISKVHQEVVVLCMPRLVSFDLSGIRGQSGDELKNRIRQVFKEYGTKNETDKNRWRNYTLVERRAESSDLFESKALGIIHDHNLTNFQSTTEYPDGAYPWLFSDATGVRYTTYSDAIGDEKFKEFIQNVIENRFTQPTEFFNFLAEAHKIIKDFL